jgi:flavorubredoxin
MTSGSDSNVIVTRVSRDLFILRYNDLFTKYFEALWEIPEGVTYNSYLLLSDNATVLFDTWKRGLEARFLDALSSIIDIRDLNYVVIHHMEPDHSGSIKALYERNRNITFIGHPMVNRMISSFYGVVPRFKAVKDGEVLTMGSYELKFIHVPWLHWPETIVSYVTQINALLTCDVFGAYTIPKSVALDHMPSDYAASMRKYFVNIIGFYRDNVIKNLDKILNAVGNKISMILPSHGAVIEGDAVNETINLYKEFTLKTPIDRRVVLVYSSMYRFIDHIMSYVNDTLRNWGFDVLTSSLALKGCGRFPRPAFIGFSGWVHGFAPGQHRGAFLAGLCVLHDVL